MDFHKPNSRIVFARDMQPWPCRSDCPDVLGSRGESFGRLEGYVLNAQSGRPSHIVVNTDGGFGSKYLLLPMQRVALDDTQARVITDLSDDDMKTLPGFDLELGSMPDEDVDALS